MLENATLEELCELLAEQQQQIAEAEAGVTNVKQKLDLVISSYGFAVSRREELYHEARKIANAIMRAEKARMKH